MLTTIFAVVLGIVLVLSFALPAVYISVKKRDQLPPDYDERQILARNRSYKLGFMVMAACNFICIYIPLFADESGYQYPGWGLTTTMFGLSLFAGFNAFAISAILQDAYIKLYESPVPYYLGSILVGGLWILQGVNALHDGGEVLGNLAPFLFGGDLILLSLIGFIHTRRHAHDDDEDDDSEDE